MKYSLIVGITADQDWPGIPTNTQGVKPPFTFESMKVLTGNPVGAIEKLSEISGTINEHNLSGEGSSPSSPLSWEGNPDFATIGYETEWDSDNISAVVTTQPHPTYGGSPWNVLYHVAAVEVTEDIDHLAIFQYSGIRYSYTGAFAEYEEFRTVTPQLSNFGANYTFIDGFPVYDRARDAIAVAFKTVGATDAYDAANHTPQNWGVVLKKISKFICEFDGTSHDIAIAGTSAISADFETVTSAVLYLPNPNKNPAGAIRLKAVMTSGESYPWQQFLCQPLGIIDSSDGIGDFSGSFVTARRSFGFTAPVTRVRWCLGMNPIIARQPISNAIATVDNSYFVPTESLQSFSDQKLYFESTDLGLVYCTDQVESGVFHPDKKAYDGGNSSNTGNAEFVTGPTGVAVACDDTDDFKNYLTVRSWPWFVADRYSTLDTLTELDKWLCPRCPSTKVLFGSCVFGFSRVAGVTWDGYFPVISEPTCTINDVEFHNFSGWDGTATRDAQLLFLPFNRSLKRWELHTGYKWEVINLMSVVWGEDYHLATISYLIDGTICTVAWKVIYTDVEDEPLKAVTYELWFKKSIDGGYTWKDSSKVATQNKPELCRVNQSPTTGKYGVLSYTSDNGGESWS